MSYVCPSEHKIHIKTTLHTQPGDLSKWTHSKPQFCISKSLCRHYTLATVSCLLCTAEHMIRINTTLHTRPGHSVCLDCSTDCCCSSLLCEVIMSLCSLHHCTERRADCSWKNTTSGKYYSISWYSHASVKVRNYGPLIHLDTAIA